MQILLINPRFEPASQPPLGLAYIAAYLISKDIDDVIIVDTAYEDLEAKCSLLSPSVIGIYSMTPYFEKTGWVVKFVRKKFPNAKVVVGGPHAKAAPEQTIRTLNVDYCVIGEGEITFFELIMAIEKKSDLKSINGICYIDEHGEIRLTQPRDPVLEINELPFPSRELLPMDYYLKKGIMYEFGFRALRSTTILSSRGCPFQCIYCNRIMGKKARLRSPDNIIKEMELLIEKYNINGLFFVDDTFTLNKKRVIELCDKIIDRKIKLEFAFNTRVDCVDKDMLLKLKAAGFSSVAFGIESGSDAMLKNLKKGITVKQVTCAVNWAKEAGMSVKGYFMIGAPGESRESLEQTLALARSIPLDQIQVSITTPYPGTELKEIAEKNSLIDDQGAVYEQNGFFKTSIMHTKDLKREEIEHFYKKYCKPLMHYRILKSILLNPLSIFSFINYIILRSYRKFSMKKAKSKIVGMK